MSSLADARHSSHKPARTLLSNLALEDLLATDDERDLGGKCSE